MAKKAYKFNPQTLTYEVISVPTRLRFYRLLRKVLIGFIFASIVNFFISYFFYTPKMYRINQENREMLLKYNLLTDQINASALRLQEIKHRDNYVYRALFSADTLSIPEVYIPYPETKYESFAGDRFEPLMIGAWSSLDAMTRLLYLESKSLDQLEVLARDKGKMSTAIPAIWPIDSRFLRGSIGAFGWRNHPISHRFAFHKGIDLGSNTGTPVYATGDGVVVKDKGSGSGYGNQIIVDHSFGYQTRFAHLSKINVTIGEWVKRGQVIGEVGNTGRSKGSHLHYEVLYRGVAVNPINYFRKDMSEQEFQRIIENATDTSYELDE